MSDTSYSATLRRLSTIYFQSRISFDEYRLQRKVILDKIDEEFNGRKSPDLPAEELEQLSHSMNTVAFCKGDDVDS
jgi:hypothetical protein